MRLLLDATIIDRIGCILESTPSCAIRAVDTVALLQFVEHILFADQIILIDFDTAQVQERIRNVIDALQSRCCIPSPCSGWLTIDQTLRTKECEEVTSAASAIVVEMFSRWLTRNRLGKIAQLVDDASYPANTPIPPVSEIIHDESNSHSSRDALKHIVTDKFAGAIYYALLTSEPLRYALRAVQANSTPFSRTEDIAIRTILRIQTNHILAQRRSALYSPAPQRARIEERAERLFRDELNATIWRASVAGAASMSIGQRHIGTLELIAQQECLPLPSLAIGVLREASCVNPLQLLQYATDVRSRKDISGIRLWLNEWEGVNASRWEGNKLSHRRTAAQSIRDELARREKELRLDVGLAKPTSILRMGLACLASFVEDYIPQSVIASLLGATGPRGFLAIVTESLASEHELGHWFVQALGRPIEWGCRIAIEKRKTGDVAGSSSLPKLDNKNMAVGSNDSGKPKQEIRRKSMPRKQKRKTHRVLRVFLASPSDVKAERAGIANAIDEVNESLSSAGIYYELIRWETHGAVGMGRPQDLVNGLVDQCDVFIGILWKKFGSPPGKSLSGTTFDSGTEEEFQRAYQRWCTNGGRADSQPRVMFFFCNRPVHPHDLNVDQLGKVLRFSEQFKPGGAHPGLYKEFIDLENLQRDVRRLLSTPQV